MEKSTVREFLALPSFSFVLLHHVQSLPPFAGTTADRGGHGLGRGIAEAPVRHQCSGTLRGRVRYFNDGCHWR